MRAFALDNFGQRVSIHDLPDPETAENEVRVRVTAASINPFDNAVLQGYLKGRMEHRFPLVPCGDLAGTVDALGAGVDGVAIGDSVSALLGRWSWEKARWPSSRRRRRAQSQSVLPRSVRSRRRRCPWPASLR